LGIHLRKIKYNYTIQDRLNVQKMCHVDFNTNEIFNYLFLKLGEDRVLNIKMQIKSYILSYPDIFNIKEVYVGKLKKNSAPFLRYLPT
jgi:hypothetical protein